MEVQALIKVFVSINKNFYKDVTRNAVFLIYSFLWLTFRRISLKTKKNSQEFILLFSLYVANVK